MKKGNPNIVDASKSSRFKSIDGAKEKMGSKVFSVRLPESYQDLLLSMSQEERVSLMRSALMEAINTYQN